MRHMHAIQLAWIHMYAWKKKHQPNGELQRSFNLARMAVQFIVRQVLERLFVYNKGKLFFVLVIAKYFPLFLCE